ncbi:hypothetical protein M0805_003334 [Coniferiporia weirii]|nr:hypothetical protein M0805_003334 [Coniferiporia weirii]
MVNHTIVPNRGKEARHEEQVQAEGIEGTQASSLMQTGCDLDLVASDGVRRHDAPSQHTFDHRRRASASGGTSGTGSVPVSSYGSQVDVGIGELVDSRRGKPLIIADLESGRTASAPSKSSWERGYTNARKFSGNLDSDAAASALQSEANDVKDEQLDDDEEMDGGSDQLHPRTLHSFFDFKDGNDIAQAIPTPEDYHRFYWKCMGLKSELVRLDFALRPVGSSGPGIQAANIVKAKLRQLRDLSGMNTSALFPHDVNVHVYTPTDSKAYLSQVSRSLEDFAEGLDMMAKALNDFNGVYHDEKLMLLLFSLHKRFMDEAMKTSVYYAVRHTRATEEFRLHFQMLLKDWIEAAVESLTEAIRDFNDEGVRTIYSAQQHKTSRYLNMTTIATFFSAVTATMLQFTIDNNSRPVSVATNTFMFSSLVFSIGSAVNSLLVTAWRRSFVREPDQALSSRFSGWLNAGPMVSLVVAGVFFSIALCLLMFSSSQHLVTTVVVVTFSGIHTTGLLLLSVCFISQKWRFRREAGPVGKSLTRDSLSLYLIDMVSELLQTLRHLAKRQRDTLHKIPGVRSEAIEAQSMFSEKVELFEPFEGPALQNALSDEEFLLNGTYVYGFSSELWTAPTLDLGVDLGSWRSDYTFRTTEKGVTFPDAEMGWGANVWSTRAYPAAADGRRSWGREDTGAPRQEEVQTYFTPIAKMPADRKEHIPDADISPNLSPRMKRSNVGNASHNSSSPKEEDTPERHVPEQELPEHDDGIPITPERVENDRKNERGEGDPGHQQERPKRPQEPHPYASPVWHTVPPRVPGREGKAELVTRYYSRPGMSTQQQAYRAQKSRGDFTEGVSGAALPPPPGSDVRAAACFLEPNQGRASRFQRTRFILSPQRDRGQNTPFNQPAHQGWRVQEHIQPSHQGWGRSMPLNQSAHQGRGVQDHIQPAQQGWNQISPHILATAQQGWGTQHTPFAPYPLRLSPRHAPIQSEAGPRTPFMPPSPSWSTWQPDFVFAATPSPQKSSPRDRPQATPDLFVTQSSQQSMSRYQPPSPDQDLPELLPTESIVGARPPETDGNVPRSPQSPTDGHRSLNSREDRQMLQSLEFPLGD